MASDTNSFPGPSHICPNCGDVAPDMVFCERCWFDDACLGARLRALHLFAKQRASPKANLIVRYLIANTTIRWMTNVSTEALCVRRKVTEKYFNRPYDELQSHSTPLVQSLTQRRRVIPVAVLLPQRQRRLAKRDSPWVENWIQNWTHLWTMCMPKDEVVEYQLTLISKPWVKDWILRWLRLAFGAHAAIRQPFRGCIYRELSPGEQQTCAQALLSHRETRA
jgi:hypothetical protein